MTSRYLHPLIRQDRTVGGTNRCPNPPHGKSGRAPSDWGRVRSQPGPGLVHPKRLQPGGCVLDSPRGEHPGLTGPRGKGTCQRRPAHHPVNVLEHHGRRYLVSVRGHGHWVRNLRAAGTGELRVGKRAEGFRSRELTDDEKVPVLRAYLRRWKVEVSPFFNGIGPDSSDEQLRPSQPIIPPSKSSPCPDHSVRADSLRGGVTSSGYLSARQGAGAIGSSKPRLA